MKVLVICSHYPPCCSPEGAHALGLCEQLSARGVQVDLLTGELVAGSPEARGFRIHPIMKSWGWSGLPTLLFAIRRLRPDVVLLIYIDWIYDCHPMITMAPAAVRWLQPSIPFITQFENASGLTGMPVLNGIKNRVVKKLANLMVGRRGLHPVYGTLLRDSSRIIALSERHAEVFEHAHPGVCVRTAVIPAPSIVPVVLVDEPGAGRHRGRALLGLSDNEVVLAYFGYVYWMKGMETLLESFGSLPSDVRLIIIGGSNDAVYLESLHELSRREGGAERITWQGYCDDEMVSLYLQAADICILPFNDGVRLNNSSFAVAAAHGLAIVTTRGKFLETPFLDGENVRLCPPKDPVALTATIQELIDFPEVRNRLAAGARKLAEDHFSWDHIAASTMMVLQATDSHV